jgi:hypothetical protein
MDDVKPALYYLNTMGYEKNPFHNHEKIDNMIEQLIIQRENHHWNISYLIEF